MQAHNGIGFDTWIILNNLPCDRQIVDINKNGEGIVFMRIFNGFIQNNKKLFPQYLIFRCGMINLIYSIKKLGKTFKLQKEILKTEKNHDEVYSDTWRERK